MTAISDQDLRQAIIDTCVAMNAQGINQGTSGNISARVDDTTWLISPSGVPYDRMTLDSIVPMDMAGKTDSKWLPSSEWRMHLDIYRARPEAMAVVHTHSTYATALSSLRQDIPPFHYMIAATGGPTLRCAAYETFGTAELSAAMAKAIEGRTACLLANHGQICFGPNLEKALLLAGEVETLCRQYAIACQHGEPTLLSEAEITKVIGLFATYGKQPAAT